MTVGRVGARDERLGGFEERTGDPPECALASSIAHDGIGRISALEEGERRLRKEVVVEGILERHQRRLLGTDVRRASSKSW